MCCCSLDVLQVEKGSVIFVITLSGTDSTSAGANLTILISQLQQDVSQQKFWSLPENVHYTYMYVYFALNLH